MKVLVIGCGYLGLEVARQWLTGGHDVFVVTRNELHAKRFKQAGFDPVIADITKADSLRAFPELVDVVLFAVGFDRASYSDIRDVYVTGLKNVLIQLNDACRHFIYISSTGVYGDCDSEWVNELTTTSPIRPGGKACLEAETLIRSSSFSHRSTILRLAGIYGVDRVPCFDDIKNKDWSKLGKQGHINLIHRIDAANIIVEMARLQLVNELLLVSDGHPVPRRLFYDFIAKQLAVGPIDWSIELDPQVARRSFADKKVSNQKLIEKTKYRFKYPNFQSGLKDALTVNS